MRARVAVALLLLIATTTFSAPTSVASQTALAGLAQVVIPPSGQIAFASHRNGNFDIYVMDGDGGNPTQITTDPADDTQPAWSPEGLRIAFVRNSDIWVMNADGSDETPLDTIAVGAEFDESSHPTWSPDGTKIAYEHDGEIWTVNPDGSDPMPIVDLGTNQDPAWSPAGDQIAFVRLSEFGMGSDVFVKNVSDTTGQGINLTNSASAAISAEPTWTRDGTHIAFTRQTLVLLKMPSHAERAETILPARSSPSQSDRSMPLGPSAASPVAGCVPATGVRDICMIDASGGGVVNLTSEVNGELNADPAVAPDGARFAMERRICVVPPPAPPPPPPSSPPVPVPGLSRSRAAAATTDPSCPFGSTPSYTLAVMNADGTGDRDLTAPSAVSQDIDPAWRPGVDVSILKTDAPDPVSINAELTYDLTITNNSLVAASGVVVSDSLPSTVTLVSATTTQGACSGTTLISCSLGTLMGGTAVTVTIVVIAPPTPGVIVNTATVDVPTPYDVNLANNVATEETTVVAADLSLSKSDDPDPVVIGKDLTYTLTVNNPSDVPATGVTVTDTLPAEVTLASAAPPGACSGRSTITCSLDTVPPGTTATVSLLVRAPATSGVIRNSATVTAVSPADPDLSNNTDTVDTTVIAADVSITKTVSPDPALLGGQLTYTMVVKDNGALAATDVVLTDPIPEGTRLRRVSSTAGMCSGASTVTCTIGRIESGASETITVVVTVHGAERVLRNTATVTSTSPDDVPQNNTATVRTGVGQPSLALLPPVGPPGFVTIAVGSGFPRHTDVTLTWDPGIGEVGVTTDADGAFSTQVLIFRGDIEGPRLLIATGAGFEDVSATFLVEPATIQPREFASRS